MQFRLAVFMLVMLMGIAPGGRAQSRGVAEAGHKLDAGRILLKWGGYVERVEGRDRRAWAAALWPTLATADAGNLQLALRAVTYEGMRNALLGQKPNDGQIIERMARLPAAGGVTGKVLGDLAEDLVYTPIAPCRIVDTRVFNQRLLAGSVRVIDASVPAGNFAPAGGSDTDCGIPFDPAALAISITALGNTTTGYLRVYPYNGTSTQGSTVPLATLNTNVSNDVIVPACQMCVQELQVFSSASTHFAMTVTGYFMAPRATPLACYSAELHGTAQPGLDDVRPAPECLTGYTRTGLECFSDNKQGDTYLRSFQSPDHGSTGNIGCVWTNKHASQSTTVRAISRCCRVPGR